MNFAIDDSARNDEGLGRARELQGLRGCVVGILNRDAALSDRSAIRRQRHALRRGPGLQAGPSR